MLFECLYHMKYNKKQNIELYLYTQWLCVCVCVVTKQYDYCEYRNTDVRFFRPLNKDI